MTTSVASSGILHLPYNTVKFGFSTAASIINYSAAPLVGLGGKLISVAFNEANYYAGSAATAAATFGLIAYKGAQMVKTPFSAKATWISVENRFKYKFELKAKLVNLSELVGKITPDAIPGTTQVNAIAGVTVFQANITSEEAQAKALKDKNAADRAQAAANQKKREFDQAEEIANTANTFPAIQFNPNDAITTRAAANLAKEEYDEALAVATTLRTEATVSKTKAKEAKKQAETAQKQTEIPKKKEDDSIPEGNHLISYNVEKSKPKVGETYIPIPMSNNAILINHENMKKDFLRFASGMPILATGALGVIGSASEFEKALIGTECLQTISQMTLGHGFTNAAWLIRKPVQVFTGTAVHTATWLASYDTLGLSKLTTAAGLGYVAYKLFSGGLKVPVHGYEIAKPIDGVWFDFKNADPTAPKVRKDVIVKDIGKIALATALIGAAIFSVDDFFSGNYYA